MSAQPHSLPRSCDACELEDRPFCGSAPAIREIFARSGFPAAFPRGAVLFREGDPSRGIFVVCSGKVKLTTSSLSGKTLIARIAQRGDVLGMSAAILDGSYETTAEIVEQAHVTWLSRDAFLTVIHEPEAAVEVAKHLTANAEAMQRDLRSLLLAPTMVERLAYLLLDWCDREGIPGPGGVRIQVTYTHDEIAQFIGTTRETVTRMLSQLKKQGVITVRGATMYVDTAALPRSA